MITRRITLDGQVQGVGFRPFLYQLAQRFALRGWVRNLTGTVEVVVEGGESDLQAFVDAMLSQAPPLAKPRIVEQQVLPPLQGTPSFQILPSESSTQLDISLPPDYSVCADCIAELRDPANRRYQYPFINCTQCGPRYTLILDLPYDRANTSMAEFSLCARCEAEYTNPQDRRFHAQPIACPDCGPNLSFHWQENAAVVHREAALEQAVAAILAGKIIAVKGIGGYHLCCDATNDDAVLALRQRKQRPHKPLAVLFPSEGEDELQAIRRYVTLNSDQQQLLTHAARPIVILEQMPIGLSKFIAPGMQGVGAMLPYSPLHYLLLDRVQRPMVATSANLSGEPVMTAQEEVELRLGGIADGFLHHNRPIRRPADDSVFRIMDRKPVPIRLGRGMAPVELRVPFRFPRPCLAVGAHTKNTVALGWDDRVVISPHTADLTSLKSQSLFEQLIADLQSLYRVTPEVVLCDLHTHYFSSRWAQSQSVELVKIAHHKAHASALFGEHQLSGKMICFAWDGVGLGEDGTLCGGETWLGRPGDWQRTGRLRPFKLPGGEKVSRDPWRSAASLVWTLGVEGLPSREQSELLYQAWQKNVNSPLTSAVGRLFDGAAAILGICEEASFEGQGPMLLESIAEEVAEWIDMPIAEVDGLLELDWSGLILALLTKEQSLGCRAGLFHQSLAKAIVTMAKCIRSRGATDLNQVGLTGGVFQNKRLTELALKGLQEEGFDVYVAQRIPCNDAGISFGQLMEWSYRPDEG